MTGLILMGGENSRMGGAKKALLTYDGTYFYARIVSAMRNAGIEEIFASVEKNWDMELGIPQLTDRYDKIGPLGGIVTALEAGMEVNSGMLVVPCDVPFISSALLKELVQAYKESLLPVVLTHQGRVNPLVAVYTQECLPILKQQIAEKNYRASFWTKQLLHKEIVFEHLGLEEKEVANINTRALYEEQAK